MDRRIDSRARRTLGVTAAGFAVLLAATGCSSTGSSDDSSSAPATQETSAAASSSAPVSSSAASSASETATAEKSSSSAPATKAAPAKDTSALDTVKNKEHKIAVVSTGASASGKDSLDTKLIIADHGCFHAVNQQGPPTLLVFPEDTTLNSKGKPTVTVGGTSVRVGQQVTFTGKKINLSTDQASQAKPCRAKGDVFQVASAK
ncbi:hypothetical protein CIK75_07145 [Glutamicibacter sp. BW78]|uniref:hypothetical protein n=1 Tax=Glutamicibacter sp. BW78 TaxID=2024403 RepID=UPI000BB757CC|nr:hypothetical protein [Glutamicibacter sp. BW78]PCC25454.1 hypothetical protein CIK75_07145 [Glutamicibacter sp. BW78]